MNAQNPGQAKPADPKDDDVAKAAEKPKPAESPKTDPVAEQGSGTARKVTLVHPELGTKVQVTKPSMDYTNYVRSYGYQEKGSK